MKRSVSMVALAVLFTSFFIVAVDAWARAGGGGSSGSRGSRSYSAPARPSVSPSSPSRPAPPTSFQQPGQRSGFMGGLMGGIGGLLVGGLIGSMLFGGLGHGLGGGLGGGIGILEILIVGVLAFVAISYFRRRQQQSVATASPGYAGHPAPAEPATWRPEPVSRATAVLDVPAPSEIERGVGHIRQMDVGFAPERLTEAAQDTFFKVQAAWMARDMGSVRDLLTPEMHASLQKDCDRLRAEHRMNRLENIAVRSVQLSEAWQENGQDFVTVSFLANLLDYTTDEGGQVVEGSRTEPVKFEEFWTFARPVGPNAWKLSAIQQAA